MDIKKLVSGVKKPWYVPSFIWNMAIVKVADLAREHLKVHDLSGFAAGKVMSYLCSAVSNCSKREAACRIVSRLGNLATASSNALADGVITSAECEDVGNQIQALLELAIDQYTINTMIEDAREGLQA